MLGLQVCSVPASLISFLDLFIFLVFLLLACMSVLPTYMSYTTCIPGVPQRPEEHVGSPGTGVLIMS